MFVVTTSPSLFAVVITCFDILYLLFLLDILVVALLFCVLLVLFCCCLFYCCIFQWRLWFYSIDFYRIVMMLLGFSIFKFVFRIYDFFDVSFSLNIAPLPEGFHGLRLSLFSFHVVVSSKCFWFYF